MLVSVSVALREYLLYSSNDNPFLVRQLEDRTNILDDGLFTQG